MEIGVTEKGDVFIFSSKEHSICHISEERMIAGNGQLELLFGGVTKRQSRWCEELMAHANCCMYLP